MAQALPGANGVSPDFLQALEVLIQVHARELATACPLTQEAVALPASQQESELAAGRAQVMPSNQDGQLQNESSDTPKSTISKLGSSSYNNISYCEYIQEELTRHTTSFETIDVIASVTGGRDSPEGVGPIMTATSTKGVMTHGLAKGISMFGDIGYALSDGTQIDEYEYDVSKFYKDTGVFQALARNEVFGWITLFVICINAVYLGIQSDKVEGADPQGWEFHLLDNVFCVFFLFEWTVRFLAFKRKRDGLKDHWFRFDFFLIFTMVIDTWILPLVWEAFNVGSDISTGPESSSWGTAFKSVRLLRLARMVRICHALPELATLMKAIFAAMRAVFSALLLQIMIIYVWAIAMHSLLKDEADSSKQMDEYWGSVTRCMMTLITNGTLGDSIGSVMRGVSSNVTALILFFAFVLLSTITVSNMLIGLLCEVVAEVANAEKDYVALAKLKSEILTALKHLDKDGSGDVTKAEFLGLMTDPHSKTVMSSLDIDVKLIMKLVDMLYNRSDSSAMRIPDLMQLLLDSQGNRKPTFQDIVSLLGFTRWSIQQDLAIIKDELVQLMDIDTNLTKAVKRQPNFVSPVVRASAHTESSRKVKFSNETDI